MDQSYQGLKPGLKDELVRYDRPEEFTDYAQQVIKLDNRMYKRQLEKGGVRCSDAPAQQRHGQNKKQFKKGKFYKKRDLDVMEIDTIQRDKTPKAQGIHQKTDNNKKGNCFKCNKPGDTTPLSTKASKSTWSASNPMSQHWR
jgi:hypothetical protein